MPGPTLEAVQHFINGNDLFFRTPLTKEGQKKFQEYYQDANAIEAITDYSTKLEDILYETRDKLDERTYQSVIYSWRKGDFAPALKHESIRQFIMDNQDHPAILIWNSRKYVDCAVQLLKVTKAYKNDLSSSEDNIPIHIILDQLITSLSERKTNILDSFLTKSNEEKKKETLGFYEILKEDNFKNLKIIENNEERSTKHFFQCISIITDTLATGILPDLQGMAAMIASVSAQTNANKEKPEEPETSTGKFTPKTPDLSSLQHGKQQQSQTAALKTNVSALRNANKAKVEEPKISTPKQTNTNQAIVKDPEVDKPLPTRITPEITTSTSALNISEQCKVYVKKLSTTTKKYQASLPKEGNEDIHSILKNLITILTSPNAENDPKKTLENFYEFLDDDNEKTKIKNMEIIKNNKDPSTLRFIAGITVIVATLLTGILPGLIAIGVVCTLTKKSPLSLFEPLNTKFIKTSENLKEKLNKLKEEDKDKNTPNDSFKIIK